MIMDAMVLSATVQASTFYDQGTGAAKPGYSARMTVLDMETHEKYECQVSSGFAEFEELKQLQRLGGTAEQFEEVATRLGQSLPPEMTRLPLEVVRIKGKGTFLTLVCRLAQAAVGA